MKNDGSVYIPNVRPGKPISRLEAWQSTSQLVQHFPLIEPAARDLRDLCPGWVPLFWDFCGKLASLVAQSARGSKTRIASVSSGETGFLVVVEASSAAVDGLTRKYQEKSRHTCANCGAPGKPYRIDHDKQRPLCANCAAPFMLADDLKALDRMSVNAAGACPFVVPHGIPKTLRPAFDLWMSSRPMVRMDNGKVLGCYPWDFVAWVAGLLPLKNTIAALVKERQKGW